MKKLLVVLFVALGLIGLGVTCAIAADSGKTPVEKAVVAVPNAVGDAATAAAPIVPNAVKAVSDVTAPVVPAAAEVVNATAAPVASGVADVASAAVAPITSDQQ